MTANQRAKLYWIAGFTCSSLFFLAVGQIAYVVTEPADFLGLVSHLPALYWAGLTLLVICSVLVFFEKVPGSDALHLFLLAVLGLYIFGVATLVEENVRHATAYHNISDVQNILATGHSDITGPQALEYYRTWPAVHFLASITMLVGGFGPDSWLQIAPWLWLALFVCLSYTAGRRLGLAPNRCFLVSFLALSSYWMLQSDLSQQAVAGLLMLLLFAFVLKPMHPYTRAEVVVIVLVFSTLVLTHGLASVAALLSLTAVVLFRLVRRQQVQLMPLLPCLWLSWYLLQATAALRLGVRKWLSAPWEYILRMGVHIEGVYEAPVSGSSSVAPALTHYSQIGLVAILGILTVTALVGLLAKTLDRSDRPRAAMTFVWLIGAAFGGFVLPQKEMWARLVIVGLVPVLFVIVRVLPYRRLMVGLAVLCLVLILPARYGTEALNPFAQVYSTELAGVRFFGAARAESLLPNSWFVYRTGDRGVLTFYDPNMRDLPQMGPPAPTSADLSEVLDGARYILNSNHGGVSDAAIAAWMATEGGEMSSLVYDNGGFRVYVNNQPAY